MGFWYGKLLKDEEQYLEHGTNKQIYYKIYRSVNEIDASAIIKLLEEAVDIDFQWNSKR